MNKLFKRIALLLAMLILLFSFVSCNNANGILSIIKTSSEGLIDTYTITYSDGSKTTFTVTNGAEGIQGIQGEKGEDGHTPVITIQNGYWYIDGINTGQRASEIVQEKGNNEDVTMSQKAVTEQLNIINAKLDIIEGKFYPEFELGRVSIDEKDKLNYTDNRFEIRTKHDYIYGVPSGTGFTLSSYSNNVLIIYYSYDGGKSYQAVSRTEKNIEPIVMKQDALIAIRLYNTPSKTQKDMSLADLLVVNFSTNNSIEDIQVEINNLNSAIKYDLNDATFWENGGITSSGSEYKSNKVLRTKNYLSSAVNLIYAEKDYTFTVFAYDENENCIGVWDGVSFSTSARKLYYFNTKGFEMYQFRLMIYRFDATSIDLTESDNVHFLNSINAKMFFPTPTLTFIDDDGSLNALENWESIADEIGIKITAALVTGVMGDGEKNPTKASWEDVIRLQNKGFEFVSHTHNHINLTTSSQELIIRQFEASIAALRAHGCESRYLVYPYNAITPELIPLVKRYFSAGIGLGMESENTLPLYTYHIRRYSINDTSISVEKEYNGETVSVHSFKSLDTLKGYIDDALNNGGWVIIMTHLRNDGIFYFDDEAREMIIELCKYATKKGFDIKTFGEAFETYKNIMENGTVYDSNHYIVDCNGVAHYRGE